MAGYKEIADVIMENIASGVLPPGTPVPSLHTICKEFKVSYSSFFTDGGGVKKA